jgi:hypothetical protein
VTHTADVAVKKALIGEVNSPVLLAMGKRSRNVPIPINAAKPYTIIIDDDIGVRELGTMGSSMRHGWVIAPRIILTTGFGLSCCFILCALDENRSITPHEAPAYCP